MRFQTSFYLAPLAPPPHNTCFLRSHLAVSQTQKHTTQGNTKTQSFICILVSDAPLRFGPSNAVIFFPSSGFLSNLAFISIKLFLIFVLLVFSSGLCLVCFLIYILSVAPTINLQEIWTDKAENRRLNLVFQCKGPRHHQDRIVLLTYCRATIQRWGFRNTNIDLGGLGLV